MKEKRFYEVLIRIVLGVALLLCVFLFCLTISERGLLSMHGGDLMTFSKNGYKYKVAVLCTIFLFGCAGYFLKGFLRNIDPQKLFCLGAALTFIVGLFIILGTNEAMFYDDKKVYDAMKSFRSQDYSALLPGNYLFMFPFQISLILYEALLSMFNSRILFLYLVNLFFVLGIHYFQWKLSEIFFPKRKEMVNLSIVLSFCFLPLLFLSLWVYGDIPGLFFSLGGCCLCLNGSRKGSFLLMWIGAGMLAVACWLRMNYLIMAAALFIIFIIESLRYKTIRDLGMIGIFCVIFFFGKFGMEQYVENVSGMRSNNGIPTVLYVVMGLQDSREEGSNAGWWNSYSWAVYEDCAYDEECAVEKGISDLRSRFEELRSDSFLAADFFFAKIKSTWCDPTFQSLWYGSLHIFSGPLKHGNEVLRGLRGENGGKVYISAVLWCGVLETLVFLFGAVFSWAEIRRKTRKIYLLPVLFFIGTFLFHLVWETKSRYVLPAVYCLIPYAAAGIFEAGRIIKPREE